MTLKGLMIRQDLIRLIDKYPQKLRHDYDDLKYNKL